jgi:hypothetical protein
VASKSESEITTKTSGGSVQPPPNAQIAESVTYARGISGIESPILARDLQVSENLTHISISV